MGSCLSVPANDSRINLTGGWMSPPIRPPRKDVPGKCKCAVPHRRKLRVLCIDGGGVRGIIPLYVLRKITKITGKAPTDLFDLMAGTSVGGIITMALNLPKEGSHNPPLPKYDIDFLIDWFKEKAPVIFPSPTLSRQIRTGDGMLGTRYDPKPVDDLLKEFFGDAWLSQSIRDTLVVSYEITTGLNMFFKSRVAWRDPVKRDFLMWKVCRSTSAAPSYYPPCEIRLLPGVKPEDALERPLSRNDAKLFVEKIIPPEELMEMQAKQKELIDKDDTAAEKDKNTIFCIDGGLIANNPSMCAYTEGLTFYTDFVQDRDDIFLVSLGTGYMSHSYDRTQSQKWGALQWVKPLLEIMMDGTATATHFQMRQLMLENNYHRFDVNITPRDKDREWLASKGCPEKEPLLGQMDCTDPINIEYLERRIEEYLEGDKIKPEFDRMIAVLSEQLTTEESILTELQNFFTKVTEALEEVV